MAAVEDAILGPFALNHVGFTWKFAIPDELNSLNVAVATTAYVPSEPDRGTEYSAR